MFVLEVCSAIDWEMRSAIGFVPLGHPIKMKYSATVPALRSVSEPACFEIVAIFPIMLVCAGWLDGVGWATRMAGHGVGRCTSDCASRRGKANGLNANDRAARNRL